MIAPSPIKTSIGGIADPNERFFAYALERETIRLRRACNDVMIGGHYTNDPILQKYRFCNIFREDDKTTIWFRKNIRDPLRNKPEVLLATVVFRWFNRISTGEAIFCQTSLYNDGYGTAWEEYLRTKKSNVLLHAIKRYCGKGPYVTGSYTINTMGRGGGNKMLGVLELIDEFNKGSAILEAESLDNPVNWRQVAEILLTGKDTHSLEWVWKYLRQFSHMGNFMSYEVVTDLRHTALLDGASDIMTWANPGPGARRGLNRLLERDIQASVPRGQLIEEMVQLLSLANKRKWDMLKWELREVEHTLCEFDKYERARLGQGRPRGVFP